MVGAGSTLLLLARNKDDLEVRNLALKRPFSNIWIDLQVTKEIVRDVRPGLAVEVQSLDLATADKEAFERAVKGHQGSADHEVGWKKLILDNIIEIITNVSQRLQLSSTTLARWDKMVARSP